MKKIICGFGVVLAGFAGADTSVTTNGTELTINVPGGAAYTHVEAIPSTFTKITKTGTGNCAFAPSSVSFAGTVDVQAGTLHGDRTKFGTPSAWKVTPGAALRFDSAADYAAGETGKPSGTLEIGGFGCDGSAAFSYTMLPSDTYTTTHQNFAGGVTLTADTSVGGGRLGFGDLDMQGHDLYLYCTNGQAQFETYYKITNLGNFYVKRGKILIERDTNSAFSPITNQCYILANDTTICMYNFYARTDRPSALDIRLEDGASATLNLSGTARFRPIATGGSATGISARGRNSY